MDQSIQSRRVNVIAAGLMDAICQANLDFADIDIQLFAFTYNVISQNTNNGSPVSLGCPNDIIWYSFIQVFGQSETVMTFSSVSEGRQENSHLSHHEMARTISAEAQDALMSIVSGSDGVLISSSSHNHNS